MSTLLKIRPVTVPILIALWRCACGTLDIYADQQWSEVRKLAESYEVDIDHAMDPIPVVPAAENFMSQPYLQACLFDQEGAEVFLDGRLDRAEALREGRAAEAVEARLAGLDLDDDEPDLGRRGEDGFDLGDVRADRAG